MSTKMEDGVESRRVRSSVADIGEIIIIGELLREKIHRECPQLITNRRYHLRNYTSCFVGNELVDWLVRTGEAADRETAVLLMRILQENDILHHVCDDHMFKDEMLFYRFRKEDGTFPRNTESAGIIRGCHIYHSLLQHKNNGVIKTNKDGDNIYHHSFLGRKLVDWIVANGGVTSRADAVRDCRIMLEHGIIRHVTDDHHFIDGDLLYQFQPNFGQKRKLSDLITRHQEGRKTSIPVLETYRRFSADCNSKRTTSECSTDSQDSGIVNTSPQPSGADLTDTHHVAPPSVLITQVSADELEDPESPYVKKCIRIISDSVGYGFVIRGDSPTYVQTVDPTSPAASAGLKVRQFLFSVNGQHVLRKNHREVAKIILDSNGFLDLLVLVHRRDVSL